MKQLRSRFSVETDFGPFLGGTRIRLLECVEKHGSISKAAQEVPISYKAAWDAIDEMNNIATHPLVARSVGGRKGGGTMLTDYGRQVIALYRALEGEYQVAFDGLINAMHSPAITDVSQFKQLLRRMSMKSSVRNQFAGNIESLKRGPIDCEVRIKLDDTNEIVAVITHESAENMSLEIGTDVHALVASSAIMLIKDADVRTSARNHWRGTVMRIHEGPVNSEVILNVGNEKTISAVITRDSVEQLELAEGDEACAIFKASAVILCL